MVRGAAGDPRARAVSVTAPVFYRVKEVIIYQRTLAITSEIIPGIWEEAILLQRLGQERWDSLRRFPNLVERIEP